MSPRLLDVTVWLLMTIELITLRCLSYESADGILALLHVAPTLHSHLITEALTLSEYAEVAHIYAISVAFSIVVQSYMPAITVGYDYYTRRVVGHGVHAQASPRFTEMCILKQNADFMANHFVLLAAQFYEQY